MEEENRVRKSGGRVFKDCEGLGAADNLQVSTHKPKLGCHSRVRYHLWTVLHLFIDLALTSGQCCDGNRAAQETQATGAGQLHLQQSTELDACGYFVPVTVFISSALSDDRISDWNTKT